MTAFLINRLLLHTHTHTYTLIPQTMMMKLLWLIVKYMKYVCIVLTHMYLHLDWNDVVLVFWVTPYNHLRLHHANTIQYNTSSYSCVEQVTFGIRMWWDELSTLYVLPSMIYTDSSRIFNVLTCLWSDSKMTTTKMTMMMTMTTTVTMKTTMTMMMTMKTTMTV